MEYDENGVNYPAASCGVVHLTGSETYERYRSETASAFGREHTFFLDKEGDWERFVTEVAKYIGEKP
jgi:hypothetical protein